MSKEVMKLGFEITTSGELFVFDPQEPDCRIAVDQVVFDAEQFLGKGQAIGYAVSVHGLPQDVADTLPHHMLRHLGVGAQFKPARGVAGTFRYRAIAGQTRFEKSAIPV